MKILIISGNDRSLINFRGPLIAALVGDGHEVVACAPEETPTVPCQLKSLGARFTPVNFARAGLNPFADVLSLHRIKAVLRQERPDAVLTYTIKAVIYGTLAARQLEIPRIYTLITGLGAAFHTAGLKGWLLSLLATRFFRCALPRCTHVMVQNREIAEFLLDRRMVQERNRLTVVPGSGVDTVQFPAMPFPVRATPCFLLLGRLLKDKGIVEYVEAAREVRRIIPAARFLLIGDFDPNPAAITPDQLEAWKGEGVIEHHFLKADVRPFLAQCTTYVLPSYHEGMPRSVLEAMATARPVVTTDAIGCRETIFGVNRAQFPTQGWYAGENGLLVPVCSRRELAAALLYLAKNPQLAEAMGRRGRELAEQYFDVQKVNALMIETMKLTAEQVRTRSAGTYTQGLIQS